MLPLVRAGAPVIVFGVPVDELEEPRLGAFVSVWLAACEPDPEALAEPEPEPELEAEFEPDAEFEADPEPVGDADPESVDEAPMLPRTLLRLFALEGAALEASDILK